MKLINNFMCSDRMVEHAEKEIRGCLDLLKCCNVIFDIGANVGVYSCLFAEIFPNIDIYSFEPVKPTFDLLVRNISHNGFNNVKCFNIGFLSKKTQAYLTLPKDRNVQNIGLYSVYIKDGKSKVLANFVNLGEWCKENILNPDFIKMDTEGSELEIINSSANIIKATRYIMIEENPSFFKNNELQNTLSDWFDIKVTKNRPQGCSDLVCINKTL